MEIQVILVILLSLIVINLLVVGVYLIFLLKDLRNTVQRANEILSDVESMSSAVSSPVTSLAGVVNAVVEGVRVAKSITSLKGSNRIYKPEVEDNV